MILDYVDGRFTIKCKLDENRLVEHLDRRWNKKNKVWYVYDARLNREDLSAIAFDKVSHEARTRLQKNGEASNHSMLPKIKTEPKPFQIPATKKLLSVPTCALYAPVGSGKTKIMIDVLQTLWQYNKIDRILIIGLVSIINNWEDEIRKHWSGEPPWEHMWITGIESYSAGKLYGEVGKWLTKDTCIVVDESSKIKNMKAKRTDRVIRLGDKVKYKYIMTGTPVLNGNIDIYAQFRFLDHDIIGIKSFIGFRNRYAIMGGFQAKKIIAYKRQDELMENLRPYSFVISKKEAMPHLPSQTFVVRKVKKTAEQARRIKKIKSEFLSELAERDVTIHNVLGVMLRISQVAGGFDEAGDPIKGGNPKMDALKDIMGDNEEEPLVVFCKYIPEVHAVAKVLPNCAVLHGGIKAKDRHQMVLDFQAGKYDHLVCQYAVGAIGINLHRSRISVFFSFDFSLEIWEQAAGRIARQQQERPMVYYPLIMEGSVDAKTYTALGNKESIAKMVKRALQTKRVEDLL